MCGKREDDEGGNPWVCKNGWVIPVFEDWGMDNRAFPADRYVGYGTSACEYCKTQEGHRFIKTWGVEPE